MENWALRSDSNKRNLTDLMSIISGYAFFFYIRDEEIGISLMRTI